MNPMRKVLLGYLLVSLLTSCGVPVPESGQTTAVIEPIYPPPLENPTNVAYPPPALDLPSIEPLPLALFPPNPSPLPPEQFPLPSLVPNTQPTPKPYIPLETPTIPSYALTGVPFQTPTFAPPSVVGETVTLPIQQSLNQDERRVDVRVGQYLVITTPYPGPGWRLTYDTTVLTLDPQTNVSEPGTAGWKWQAEAVGRTIIRMELDLPCDTFSCSPEPFFNVTVTVLD